jgi:hypothetical protein
MISEYKFGKAVELDMLFLCICLQKLRKTTQKICQYNEFLR